MLGISPQNNVIINFAKSQFCCILLYQDAFYTNPECSSSRYNTSFVVGTCSSPQRAEYNPQNGPPAHPADANARLPSDICNKSFHPTLTRPCHAVPCSCYACMLSDQTNAARPSLAGVASINRDAQRNRTVALDRPTLEASVATNRILTHSKRSLRRRDTCPWRKRQRRRAARGFASSSATSLSARNESLQTRTQPRWECIAHHALRR